MIRIVTSTAFSNRAGLEYYSACLLIITLYITQEVLSAYYHLKLESLSVSEIQLKTEFQAI